MIPKLFSHSGQEELILSTSRVTFQPICRRSYIMAEKLFPHYINQGFHTWVSNAYELSQLYDIDIDSCSELPPDQFKQICNERLKNRFITSWLHDLHNCNTSIIRTYRSYKLNFGMECYLKHVNNSKFRVALFKLRTSSHRLEIERGRYTRPKLNLDQRLCMSCNVVEDEEHFVLHCQDNRVEREFLFQKIYMRDSLFLM